MLRFRKKILFFDLLLFFVFIALLFPLVEGTVTRVMRRSLYARAKEVVIRLQKAPHLDGILSLLQTDERFIFQRVVLLDADSSILYDSHIPREGGEESEPVPAEMAEALHSGLSYREAYSESFHETFAFVDLSFLSGGKTYVLRVGFPLHEIDELTLDFELGFILFAALVLLLYSMMTWVIIHRLSRPIQEIIDAVTPYQEGREEFLPKISFSPALRKDEFSKLATTLNSLSERIQKEIRHLKQQRLETEGILDSLGEGIIAFDPSGKITFANEVASRMIGSAHKEMLGQSLNRITSVHPDLSQKSHELVQQVLQTSESVVQTWTHQSGGRIVLDLISAPLAQQNGAILVLQDKTSDYKVLEMGKDFIANASHELRTPITIIRGFAETLQDIPDVSAPMLKEITEKIVRTCGRLDKLVKSLLLLSDIEHLSPSRFQQTDLLMLIENCKYLLLSAHPGVHVTIQSEWTRILVSADADLLELAILNLMENSVKYSPAPATIEVQLRKAAQGEKLIFVEVSDQGIGIPEPDLPHIFDRFYTVDKARSRKSGGAGLGLSIVKTIVEKHLGKITVASTLGRGSVFTTALPLTRLE